jgi:hypothetical protein
MKHVACLVILACIALCAGCTTVNTTPQAPAATPSLLGNWTGPAKGYTEGIGYRDFQSVNITMSVTDQKDRFFSGYMTLPRMNGTTRTEGFAGIISHDGKIFRIIEYDLHEHDDGWILSDNTIEMIFMYEEEPQSILLYSLKRLP